MGKNNCVTSPKNHRRNENEPYPKLVPTDPTGVNCCTAKTTPQARCLRTEQENLFSSDNRAQNNVCLLIKAGFILGNLYGAFQPQAETFLQLNYVIISLYYYYFYIISTTKKCCSKIQIFHPVNNSVKLQSMNLGFTQSEYQK